MKTKIFYKKPKIKSKTIIYKNIFFRARGVFDFLAYTIVGCEDCTSGPQRCCPSPGSSCAGTCECLGTMCSM